MFDRLRKLGRDQHGATAMEYVLMCALIAVAAAFVMSNFGAAVARLWNSVNGQLTNLV